MMRTVPSIPTLLLLAAIGCGSIEPAEEDVLDGLDATADDGVVETHTDVDARDDGREDVGADIDPADCLVGTVLTLAEDPPHVWVCSIPEDDRSAVCPDRWFTNATDCGPLGGMFGFYRIAAGVFEFRCYGAVTASHGTITDFGQTVTDLAPGVRVEVYFVDGRYLWFQFTGPDSVTLDGYTMTPPG